MNFIKKQGLGTWLSLVTAIIAVIGLIIYGAAISAGNELLIASGSEPFYDPAVTDYVNMTTTVTTCGILALVFLVAAIVIGQFQFGGLVGKIVDLVVGAVRIIVPVLLVLTLLAFLSGSFTGLGWTFFSNAELEIYPEAIAVGKQVITGLVILAVSFVVAIVAAFFAIRKKA